MTSPSPFLESTSIQFAWDSTSLSWFKTCPRLYQYHMIEGWRPKGQGLHLRFGGLYHSGLELYDKLRAGSYDSHHNPEAIPFEHEEALRAVVLFLLEETWERKIPDDYEVYDPVNGHMVPRVNSGTPWDTQDTYKNRETLVRSVIWYIEQVDPAKTVILADGKPAVELSFRMELDYGPQTASGGYVKNEAEKHEITARPYVLCGHLDRVVSYLDGTYVMDRKTTKTTPGSYYFDQYSPDNQMSLYTLAAKTIYSTPVQGIIIDAAQIAVGFTRFVRGVTYRTDDQLEEWLVNTKVWLNLAEDYATKGFWPMNDKSCHQYGGCSFRKVCSKSPSVRQNFLESDFEKRPWNPLEVR